MLRTLPHYYPSESEFLDLIGKGNAIPVYRQLIADTLTPVSAFQKLGNHECAFLLESVTGGEHVARYSFIGVHPSQAFVLRDRTLAMLEEAGFRCFKPQGAYYIMTDISAFGFSDDIAFTRHLIQEVGVAPVPGSSFYSNPTDGSQQVRFCFCKTDATLDEAARRLKKLRSNL